MLLILLSIYAVFHLVVGSLAYAKIMKFYKYYSTVYPHLQNLPKQWQGFIRQDKHQWNKKEILFGCFVRLPIKLFIFIQYILGCFFFIILTIPLGSQTCNKVLKFYGRYYGTYLFKLIWTITDPVGINKKTITTPLVISNHVCWIDTMYLIVTFYPISFLSKSQVAKIPVVGKITTNAQSIYIERNDENAREKIVQDIKGRVTSFLEKAREGLYEQVYPLIIFPEGTTSNGKSLLKFKLGAFNDLSPLTLVALKYTFVSFDFLGDNFDVGMVEISQLEHFLLSFCLRVRLDVDVAQISPQKGEKPQEYCERAQKKFASMTGFKIYNSGFRQRNEHKGLVTKTIINTKQPKSKQQ